MLEHKHLRGKSVASKSIETPAHGRRLCVRNDDVRVLHARLPGDLPRGWRRIHPLRHGALGRCFETMKAQFAFCRGLDLVPLVRVPSDDYHHIARALDIGAMGIMVPMVETPEQARAIVD